jgi:hypothetical protein
MITEDTTSPVMPKKSSLKDVFTELSESVAPGSTPLAVMDPKNKKAGVGVLSSPNPGVQNILKNLDPKDVQIIMTQQEPDQQQQTTPTGQAGTTSQPNQAGATGQPQAGQMQMKEKDEGKPGKNFAKIAKSAGERYGSKAAGERVAGAVRAKLAKQGKLEEESVEEGAKVDRMVKHIEKSERKLGKSKDEAQDIAWATANKRGMLDNKNKKKVKEGDIAPTSSIDTRGAGLGAGRSQTTLEGKKPDFLDLDKDGNKKEPMKKAAADKKKKKVDESMNHRISAARLEGKSHGLRGHAHSGKRYEDLEEMKAYHEGYKEGLDECYGQGVYETAMPATVPGMASAAMEADLKVGMSDHLAAKKIADKIKGTPNLNINSIKSYVSKYIGMVGKAPTDVDYIATLVLDELENQGMMDEGNAFTAALAKTPKGGKFSVGGKTFTDHTGYDAKVNEYAFESLDQQLNALLTESEEVTEGLSVSISKGQQNSPDSVTITAQDQEAEHLLAFVKNAGLGLFGDDNVDTHSSAMSIQPAHGAPDEVGAGGVDIGVVDGHDGMMGLMQKLSGIQAGGDEDYADEEGDEERLYGNHEAADKKDCGCDGDCNCDEEMCNECGGMMEAGHSCGSKEMVDEVEDDEDHDEWHDKDGNVDPHGAHDAAGHYYRERDQVDEVESEDQMEFEVSEANAPDSGEAESTADEDAEAAEDKALAFKSMNESFVDILARLEKLSEGSGDEPKHAEHDKKDDKDNDDAEEEEVTESEQLDEISDNLATSYLSKAASSRETDKERSSLPMKKQDNRMAGANLAREKIRAGQNKDSMARVGTNEEVDLNEWANQVGKGPGKGTDASFEADIDFMTKVIAGGLNKPKSTGQTTIPVIAGQDDRMHDNPNDWAALAGIKK